MRSDSSGNTGIAYALIGKVKGYKVKLVMPANVCKERKGLMADFYGAEIVTSSPFEGSDGAIILAKEIYEKDSAVLSGNPPGPHKIQGIGAGFKPNVLNLDLLDRILPVSDENAFLFARRLGKEEGITAGRAKGKKFEESFIEIVGSDISTFQKNWEIWAKNKELKYIPGIAPLTKEFKNKNIYIK